MKFDFTVVPGTNNAMVLGMEESFVENDFGPALDALNQNYKGWIFIENYKDKTLNTIYYEKKFYTYDTARTLRLTAPHVCNHY